MKERPILFDADSIRGIVAGTKAATRRVIKPQPDHPLRPLLCVATGEQYWGHDIEPGPSRGELEYADGTVRPLQVRRVKSWRCPYGQPGADRLWVKEGCWLRGKTAAYGPKDLPPDGEGWVRRHGMFMPRWASRILLEVVAVEVQRLREITPAEIVEEGFDGSFGDTNAYEWWQERWDAINAARGFPWSMNCWVWAVSFCRVEQP